MPNDLVEIARYPTSAEAGLIKVQLGAEGIDAWLDGEAMGTWFWHLAVATGGVRVLVRSHDVERTNAIVRPQGPEQYYVEIDERYPSEPFELEPVTLADRQAENLDRAWRAALVGSFLCPPVLHIYSMTLLYRGSAPGAACKNWRVRATLAVNLSTFAFLGFLTAYGVFHSTSRINFSTGVDPVGQFMGMDGAPVSIILLFIITFSIITAAPILLPYFFGRALRPPIDQVDSAEIPEQNAPSPDREEVPESPPQETVAESSLPADAKYVLFGAGLLDDGYAYRPDWNNLVLREFDDALESRLDWCYRLAVQLARYDRSQWEEVVEQVLEDDLA